MILNNKSFKTCGAEVEESKKISDTLRSPSQGEVGMVQNNLELKP